MIRLVYFPTPELHQTAEVGFIQLTNITLLGLLGQQANVLGPFTEPDEKGQDRDRAGAHTPKRFAHDLCAGPSGA